MQYGTFKKPYRAGNKSKPQYMEYKGGPGSVVGNVGQGAQPSGTEGAGKDEEQWGWFNFLSPEYWKAEADEYGYNYWHDNRWVDDCVHGQMIALEAINNWTEDFYPTKVRFNMIISSDINIDFKLVDANENTLAYVNPAICEKETDINWSIERADIKFLFIERTGVYVPQPPFDLTELEFYVERSEAIKARRLGGSAVARVTNYPRYE